MASVVVLFVWFILAKGATWLTTTEQIGLWLLLTIAHVLAVLATRLQRHGWIYLLPLVTVWVIIVVGFTAPVAQHGW